MLLLTSSVSSGMENFVSKFAGQEYEQATFDTATGKYEQVAFLAESELADDDFEKCLSVVADGGKIQIHCASATLTGHFERLLGLQGLLDIVVDTDNVIHARKPNLSQGAAVRRPRRRNLDGILGSDSASPLVSDSDLLLQEDLKRPEVSAEAVDCSPAALGKKKACKNCSCGLKEAEEASTGAAATAPKADTTNVKSSCGNVSCFGVLRCLGTFIYLLVFSVIWVTLFDARVAHIEACRLSNQVNRFNCHQTCFKMI